MRGKVNFCLNLVNTPRITPAHAGKSVIRRKSLYKGKDHPRTCGEKIEFIDFLYVKEGSPPHMRGKDIQKG